MRIGNRLGGNAMRRGCAVTIYSIAAALGALGTQVIVAADSASKNADGTMHVRAFTLPESSLLSEKTRTALKTTRERASKLDLAGGKSCPSAEGATREQVPAIRRCESEAF